MHILGKRSRSITREFNALPTTLDHGLNLIREFRHCIELKPEVLSEFLALEPVQPFLSADASLHDALTEIAHRPILLEEDQDLSRKFVDFLHEVTTALPVDPSAETVAAFYARHGMPENLAQMLQEGGLTEMWVPKKDRSTALATLKHVIRGCSGLRHLGVALNDGFDFFINEEDAAPPWECTAELVALLETARGLSSLTFVGLDLTQQDLDLLAQGLKETRGLTLKLRGGRTGPGAIAALLSPQPSLTGLHLGGIKMNDEDMKVLCEWARVPDHGLRDIRVEECKTGPHAPDLLLALLSNPGIQSIALAGDGRIESRPHRSLTKAPVFLARPQTLKLLDMPGLSAACPWIRDHLRQTESIEVLELSCLDMTAREACDLVDGLKQHANLTSLLLDAVSFDALPSLSGALAQALPHAFQHLTDLLIAPHANRRAMGDAIREACWPAVNLLQQQHPVHRLRFGFNNICMAIQGWPVPDEEPRPRTDEERNARDTGLIPRYLDDADTLLAVGQIDRARTMLKNAAGLWCSMKERGVLPQRIDAPSLSPALAHLLLQQICEDGWPNLNSHQLAEFAAAWNVPARAIAAAQQLEVLRG